MTTSATLRPTRFGAEHLFAGLNAAVAPLRQRLARAFQPGAARSATELLELARSYDSTQPSFAADLRAAAGRTPESDRT